MIPSDIQSNSVNQTTLTFATTKSGFATFTYGVGSSGTSGTIVGTTNYVPLYTGATGLGNSIMQQNAGATSVGISVTPSGTYKLEVSGTVGATAYYETSDETLKNIININPQIDLSTLEVIQFKFKGDDQVRYGYSAQEVQKLCGDLVVGTDPMTVNYSDVHTLKILQLEQRIIELERRLGL
jgi:hypothetical protein